MLVYKVTVELPQTWDKPSNEEITRINDLVNKYTGIQDDATLPSVSRGNSTYSVGNVEEWNNCLFPKKRTTLGESCESMCGLKNSEDYEYRSITVHGNKPNEGNLIFNNRRLGVGEYCLAYHKNEPLKDPHSVSCSNYGLLVFNGETWTCLSQMPLLLDGPGANIEVWGQNALQYNANQNGLFNKKTGEKWKPSLENAEFPDLKDWETRCNSRTNEGFNMLPMGAFCVVDWCSTIPFSGNKWNPQKEKCECLPGFTNIETDERSPCVPVDQAEPEEGFEDVYLQTCYTPDTPVVNIKKGSIPCKGSREAFLMLRKPKLITGIPSSLALAPTTSIRKYVPVTRWKNGMK